MSAHLERADLLLSQERYDLAERELREEIAQNPTSAEAFSLLALALAEQERHNEALEHARQGVALAPDAGWPHYVTASVLERLDKLKDAEAEAREAIRLDPYEDDFYVRLSSILFRRKQWRPALEAAEEALTLNAEHIGAANLRAMALTQLGEKDEAGGAIESALGFQPNSAVTHANQGWLHLRNSRPEEAMVHFREALRLDPNLEWARAGIVEALKAKNPLYRILLRYFFWMSRLSDRAHWGVIIGAWLVARLIPPLLPFYLIFVFLTWTSGPLTNLLLRLNRFGRLVLSDEEIKATNWTGAALLGGLVLAVAGLTLGSSLLLLGGLGCGLLVIPISGTFHAEGRGRTILAVYTLALAALGGLSLVLGLTGPDGGTTLGVFFFIGIMVYTWVGNVIIQKYR